ncbi:MULTISPECIES: hypothetical protein [Nitrospirillum]|uniref:Uncharacterized protein n=1 Tax=Nitrospirillum amazonense TaxID=28077 RepID=A0A560FV67_9PROT|nr:MULTISPECIES: hypothetical protein [Nitrospirillum]MDG3443060.1 hypothetical protein [Nitrospirillum amazonense]MEA1674382.1 hypothetical protein [Nitrospirillum sp. BR 11163]MEC4593641.1 hypothetical protein [Nitrospirillum amazonense]TWB19025.1 hypothetical protein FBZ89_10881 [Nitrospirillum amazonense]TWB25390.1 hypothetical protein FBZ88_110147 [Nitrospirillum amazonense]
MPPLDCSPADYAVLHPTLTLVRSGDGFVALAVNRAGPVDVTLDWSRLDPLENTDGLDAAIDYALSVARHRGEADRRAGRPWATAHAVVVGYEGDAAEAAVRRAVAVAAVPVAGLPETRV